MATSPAELSSLAARIEELGRLVSAGGEALDSDATADAAAALFEAERALRSAGRAVDRARRLLA